MRYQGDNLVWDEITKFVSAVTIQNPDWVKVRRMEYLKSKRRDLMTEASRWIKKVPECLIEYITIPEMEEVRRIDREIDRYEHPRYTSQITDQMIEEARNYPITELIEVNSQGFALCVNHQDKNPSMYCRNNYVHCFSCGYTGDVIDVYMKVNNVGFKEAVKELNH